jgi:hypothetical protein
MSGERSYVERLGAVLRRRDASALRTFLIDSAQKFGDARQVADVQGKSDDEMHELLHRMIVARPDLQDLHRASRQWLFEHGIDTFGDGQGERRN